MIRKKETFNGKERQDSPESQQEQFDYSFTRYN